MKIAIIGAYGYTGSLICEQLQKSRINYSIYGRDENKLIKLKNTFSYIQFHSVIDLRIQDDVKSVISSNDVIINCAGPFTEESKILVAESAINGKIYLDICGEIGFVKSSNEKYNQIAQKAKATIIHGCAFESLFADLALQKISKSGVIINSLKTIYDFNQRMISPGTRITMKLSKFRDSLKIDNGVWSISNIKKDLILVEIENNSYQYAIPYSLPEIAYAYWNYDTFSAESFLIVDDTEAKLLAEKPKLSGDPLKVLDKLRFRKKNGPVEEIRKSQKSRLIISVNTGTENEVNAILTSSDMYLNTAKSIVLAIENIVENGNKVFGVVSPGLIFQDSLSQTINKLSIDFKLIQKVKFKNV
tara:strand:- start:994 stop:2073 length:1080 start_codon:yes stop_codon:yes gene_type:complete